MLVLLLVDAWFPGAQYAIEDPVQLIRRHLVLLGRQRHEPSPEFRPLIL